MKAWVSDRVQRAKMDFEVFNGRPRATLIQRFDGSAVLLGPKAKKSSLRTGRHGTRLWRKLKTSDGRLQQNICTARENTALDKFLFDILQPRIVSC